MELVQTLRQSLSPSTSAPSPTLDGVASGWNKTALLTTYRQGFSSSIHVQMAIYDDNVGPDYFIS